MKHAILSPSASHRWLVCPGSVEANIGKPWTQSVFALEGTSAHALLEVCLRRQRHFQIRRLHADLLISSPRLTRTRGPRDQREQQKCGDVPRHVVTPHGSGAVYGSVMYFQ